MTARTAEEIRAKLATDDLTDVSVTLADNGEYYWARLSRHHNGHHYSRSKRVMMDATDDDLARIRAGFRAWWDEEMA